MLESGHELPRNKIMRIDHKMGYATLGQFLGVLHRTAPIHLGSRVTLVLNQRSAAKPYVDDNRLFYLAADNDQDRSWVDELAQDVWTNQLPAYRRHAGGTSDAGEGRRAGGGRAEVDMVTEPRAGLRRRRGRPVVDQRARGQVSAGRPSAGAGPVPAVHRRGPGLPGDPAAEPDGCGRAMRATGWC